MSWSGEERRKNVSVDIDKLAGELMKNVVNILKPIRENQDKLFKEIQEIKHSLRNEDENGLCQEHKIVWQTLFGNGKVGLCEKFRFLNWKVTLFASLGTSAVLFLKWVVEKLA